MKQPPEPSKRITLRLDLDPGAEPISGRLVDAQGSGAEFVGWLGLGAALEQLMAVESDSEAARAPHGL